MAEANTASGGAESETVEKNENQEDFYAVLGVQQSATVDEIKAAYKKLAIKWHPDKNRHQEELASAKFKEVSTAYAVLSDPATRSKYDTKGLDGLNEKDLTNVELDISSMGTMNSVFASLFSRLGVLSVKTMVASSVLENAESGKAQLRPLSFGTSVTDRVNKNCAHHYNLTITRENIDNGFCVWVKSPSSRFKVLMFEKREREAGGEDDLPKLDMRLQEDSTQEQKHHVAGIFFFTFTTYNLGPPPSTLQCADNPEAALFRRLDDLERRENCSLTPGEYVFSVYGDNFLKASTYTIEALHEKDFKEETTKIRELESTLVKKREELVVFENAYRIAKKNYESQVARFEQELRETTKVLLQREMEYAKLTSSNTEANDTNETGASSSNAQAFSFKKMFGMKG